MGNNLPFDLTTKTNGEPQTHKAQHNFLKRLFIICEKTKESLTSQRTIYRLKTTIFLKRLFVICEKL